ncbi:MAG: condensation domain-containing protein, partial [Oscillospiraceae bacterium]|nr:condensation domain-containing protein [Oscillospiraceae bacterium]
NAAEKALCTAFKKVLNLEKVGIYDDFYELGGDSLGSIEAILESGLPGLEASMIFRGRTAADIAKLYYAEHGMDGETNDEKNKKAMKQTHKLTIEQLYMFDYQLYTPLSTMYNLFTMLKLDKAVFEPLRLSKAAETAIKSHPALLTKFTFNDDGEIVQSYDESIMPEIRVEKISEFDLKFLKDTLVQPFKMINTRLFRCRIFETEKALYLFFDIHHTIFDGTSFKVLINSIAQAYEGVSIPTDYYYFMLKKREEIALTAFYEESRKYFEERYDGNDRITYPTVDYVTRENKIGQIQCEMNIDTAKLDSIKKHFGVSHNEFFITVSAIAVSLYSNNPNVMLSWIYNGREDAQMMNTVGLLYRDLPVAFRFDKNMNMGDIFADVHSQVQNAIKHSCYPYIEKNAKVIEGDVAAVLYQSDIRDAGKIGETDIETVEIKQNRAASQSVLDIEVLDSAKGLRLSLNYSSSRYKQTSMENFGDSFVRIAAFLAHNICENNITVGELRDEVERNV